MNFSEFRLKFSMNSSADISGFRRRKLLGLMATHGILRSVDDAAVVEPTEVALRKTSLSKQRKGGLPLLVKCYM